MNKISIRNQDGTIEEVTLINAFKISKLGKRFVILSKGESVDNETSKIYVSEFEENEPGIYSLVGIKDEMVWEEVKKAMKEIVES